MLAQENRLKKKKDFERVFKQGQGEKSGFVYLKHVKNKLDVSRFGFVIKKSFSKRAVKRNKAKRVLREAVRNSNIKGQDIVIVVMKEAKIEELKEAITQLLKKIK